MVNRIACSGTATSSISVSDFRSDLYMSKLISVEMSATRKRKSIATKDISMVNDDAARICRNERMIRYK